MLTALAVVTGFAAGFLQGFSGFGFAIFSMSLLSLVLPLAEADRMVCIMASTCVVVLTWRLWTFIEWRRLPWVAGGLIVGGPIGVWLVGPSIPDGVGKRILGAIVIGVGLYRIWAGARPTEHKPAEPGPAEMGYGLAGGILSGWVNMSGPPLVYWAHHRLEPTRARAILSACFACAAVVKITALTAGGLWIRECVIAGLVAVPAVLAGSWLGDVAARRSRPALYAKLIWGLFFLLGALLLVLPASGAKTTTNDRPSTMERPKSQAGMRSAPGPNPGGEAAWPDAKR